MRLVELKAFPVGLLRGKVGGCPPARRGCVNPRKKKKEKEETNRKQHESVPNLLLLLMDDRCCSFSFSCSISAVEP